MAPLLIKEIFMLLKFYQNTVAAISQWLETMQFGARSEPVRIRIDQSESAQRMRARRLSRRTSPGQDRMLVQKYRR